MRKPTAKAATKPSSLTSVASGLMVPRRRRRRPASSSGHRSRTWRGVSASFLQTRHRAAGHSTSLHRSHPGVGRRPIRWRYCSEQLQWPARSWCMSTAARRSSSSTGPGSRFPMMERNHPSCQFLCHVTVADLATAFCTVPVSMRVSCCRRALASRARTSARPLPCSPQAAVGGNPLHVIVDKLSPLSASGRSSFQMAAATGALWAAGPLRSRASAAIESVQTTTGRESARVSALNSFSSAALIAKSSARVLEQRELAATRTSWVSPLGNEMVAPRLLRP